MNRPLEKKRALVTGGSRGITINNVQPGPVDTDMNPATSEFAKKLVPLMAVPRYGTADEIASMVAYLLLTGDASALGPPSRSFPPIALMPTNRLRAP